MSQQQNRVVTTRDAARQLGVSAPTVIRMYREGRLAGYKLDPSKRNSHLKIYQSSIDAILAQRQPG